MVVVGIVAVVGVVVAVAIVVDALGLVVVDAMVDGALGCERLGSFDEVGVGAPLDHAVVAEIRAGLLVAPSLPLPSSAVESTLGAVVVEPTTPMPGSAVYAPAPTAPTVVLEGEVRSAPVNSSQPGPQRPLLLTSAKAPMKSKAAVIEIADTRIRRRSRQLRAGRGTAGATVPCPAPGVGSVLPVWAPRARASRRTPAGSEVGRVGVDTASAADS